MGLIFHATDRALVDLARNHNAGALRVAASPFEMYFAAGVDANPLVPGSNPKDIAQGIQTGLGEFKRRVYDGFVNFVADLLQAKSLDGSAAAQLFQAGLSGVAAIVVMDEDDTSVVLRQARKGQHWFQEYVTVGGASLATYWLLATETHALDRTGGYAFERTFE